MGHRWSEGCSARFGLAALDHATMRRVPRPVAAAYAEICRAHGTAPRGAR